MLFGITGFEIRYQLRNPVFWVAFALFFLMGFGLTASENVSMGTPGTVQENAPYALARAFSSFTMFYLFVITAFVANAIVRDDATGFGTMIRATRVVKNDLILGRFLGGLVIALLGYISIPLGMAVGVHMPWVDPETVGSMGLFNYVWHYLIIGLPNVFLMSALLMALATIFRSMMATYVGLIVFLIGYMATLSVVRSAPDLLPWVAKFELLGSAAIQEITRYWTTAELNGRLIPLDGNLLFNRLFVIVLGIAMLAVAIWRFSMAESAPSKRKLKKLAKQQAREANAALAPNPLSIAGIVPQHSMSTTIAQLLLRTRVEIMQVLKSPGLAILLLLAMMMTGLNLSLAETAYGTGSHPLTANVISTVKGGFSLFLLMIAAFYGGELVWRERDRKVNEIIDSTPTADWIMIVPKILAILVVLLLANLVGMLTGMTAQLIQQSSAFSLGQYLTWFVVPMTVDMLLLAILAVFLQIISPSKYVGWGLMLIWFVGGIFLGNMGYENELYNYAQTPVEPLSDMNGTGGFWVGAAWLRFYWFCFALLLLVAAHLLWPRGTDVAFRPRLSRIPARLSAGSATIAAVALMGMVLSGMYIYDNIKRKNPYRTADEQEVFLAGLEKKYLKNEKLPQPSITDVKITAQIYPEKSQMDVTGSYQLRNLTDQPLTEVHVRQSSQDTSFPKLSVAGAKQISNDTRYGYRIFRFDTPMAPGATATLDFVSHIGNPGFRHGAPQTNVVHNGTFVNSFVFAPVIGMSRMGLLEDRAKRRRQGLPAELRPAKLEDASATAENYIGLDWVNSDITISTDADQIPVAPGQTVSDVTKDGRRTIRFVSDAPILDFFSIQSARYAIEKRAYKGVNLAVYYHPAHNWNVNKMMNALEVGLDYYRANFGPYQFNQARIIEFPGYESFAQAFANTMPFSESIGFAADVSDPEKIDYVTYVTAHELGHQYWAHQVIGANTQGATVMSETLAQYSALMVMKKIYGPDKIRRFLKYELDRYLGGRKADAIEEMPLYRVEDQPHIYYRKGSLVMYLLSERLGEDAVNRALARFIAAHKFKGAPYPRSLDLIAEFRKEATTPEQQALITDLFEKITIYDLKAKSATTKKGADGQWTTTITVDAKKFYATGKGVETEAPLSEPIEIGLFTERPGQGAFNAKNVLIMERRPVKGGQQVIVVKSKIKPFFAGVDPYNFYIDRNSDDNVVNVTG